MAVIVNDVADGRVAPWLNFSWSPNAAYTYPNGRTSGANKAQAATLLTFTATSTLQSGDYVIRYDWDFGDGAVAQGAVVTHTFAATNPHARVTLCMTDSRGHRQCVGHQMLLY